MRISGVEAANLSKNLLLFWGEIVDTLNTYFPSFNDSNVSETSISVDSDISIKFQLRPSMLCEPNEVSLDSLSLNSSELDLEQSLLSVFEGNVKKS